MGRQTWVRMLTESFTRTKTEEALEGIGSTLQPLKFYKGKEAEWLWLFAGKSLRIKSIIRKRVYVENTGFATESTNVLNIIDTIWITEYFLCQKDHFACPFWPFWSLGFFLFCKLCILNILVYAQIVKCITILSACLCLEENTPYWNLTYSVIQLDHIYLVIFRWILKYLGKI